MAKEKDDRFKSIRASFGGTKEGAMKARARIRAEEKRKEEAKKKREAAKRKKR